MMNRYSIGSFSTTAESADFAPAVASLRDARARIGREPLDDLPRSVVEARISRAIVCKFIVHPLGQFGHKYGAKKARADLNAGAFSSYFRC